MPFLIWGHDIAQIVKKWVWYRSDPL